MRWFLLLFLIACETTPEGESCDTEGDTRCNTDAETCLDGVWQVSMECDAGAMCMTEMGGDDVDAHCM